MAPTVCPQTFSFVTGRIEQLLYYEDPSMAAFTTDSEIANVLSVFGDACLGHGSYTLELRRGAV